MTMLDLFYSIRPFIPRRLQIEIRRSLAAYKRRGAEDIWPIDRKAGNAPSGWTGWPERKIFALVLNHDVDTKKGHDQCEQLSDLEKGLGFRSSFYFVPEDYSVSSGLRSRLQDDGFEVGVHGLRHDGKTFSDWSVFQQRSLRINAYLREWGACGYSSPSMLRNLEWMLDLNIEYSVSTFDTDLFEPQPKGVRRIFPFWYQAASGQRGFVEIPYTLPQDHTLFVILKEKDNRIWKDKLDWIVEKGGMALVNTHPDYMRFNGGRAMLEEYPAGHYADLLTYIRTRYADRYWNPLAREIARFWKETKLQDQPALYDP